MDTKILTRTAFLICLGVILSYIKVFEMPQGGSVTAASMLPIILIGYYYGPKYGLLGGFIYGLISLILGGSIYSIPQALIDYIFASTALGLGSFVTKDSKFRIYIVYTIGVIGLYFFTTLSGYVFFAEYAPEGMNPLVYSLSYNASYLIPEYIFTVVIIIPFFKRYIDRFLKA